MWSADLLALGPERAEKAVRAVAELCRGTERRKPRPLEWGYFFSPRRDGSAWEAALAWKEAGASEPALNREYVLQSSNRSPNGARHDGVGEGMAQTEIDDILRQRGLLGDDHA